MYFHGPLWVFCDVIALKVAILEAPKKRQKQAKKAQVGMVGIDIKP
jgi:hypothetical protein